VLFAGTRLPRIPHRGARFSLPTGSRQGSLSHAGIAVHEGGSERLQWQTDFGEGPVWLADSRTLLFSHQRKLFLLDGVSGNVREVLATPQQNLGSVGLSRDNQTIYYSVAAAESDLCLMTIK
jgi:hypothetical protein